MASRFSSTISVSDLQEDAGAILDELRAADGPTAVSRDGRATAVLMSLGAWQKAERERQLLQRLAQGEAEIAAGQGYDLDEVLAESRRILKSPDA